MPAAASATDLLAPAVRGGRLVAEPEPFEFKRTRAAAEVARLHPGIRRFLNPHEYPVGIDLGLHEFRQQLIQRARLPET
jgi:nicotinate phosphoribosyltransferase